MKSTVDSSALPPHPFGVRTRSWLTASLVVLGLSAAPTLGGSQAPPAVRGHVRIIRLGPFPSRWLSPMVEALEATLDVHATVDQTVLSLPRSAWYEPRRRYRSERLTQFLIDRFQPEHPRSWLLGVTSRDISTSAHGFEDWGILGQANDVPGRAAVASRFRVRRGARDAAHARWRFVTTAVHEVGHVMGLEHCTEPRCLMRDARGSARTVDEGDGELGPACRAFLDTHVPRDQVAGRAAP